MAFIPRLIGIAGVVLVGKDAIKGGINKASHKTNEYISDSISDVYVKHQSSSMKSYLLEDVKEEYRKFRLDNKFLIKLHHAKDLVMETGKSIVKNAVPIGLALGAALAPNPAISAACATLFAIGGSYIFAKEVMGIGKH